MKVKANKEEQMTHQQIDKLHKMIPSIQTMKMPIKKLKNWQENLGSKDTIATFLKRIALQNEAKNDTPSNSLSNSSSFKLSPNFSQKNIPTHQPGCYPEGSLQHSITQASRSNITLTGNKQEDNTNNQDNQRKLKNNWMNIDTQQATTQQQADIVNNKEQQSLSQRKIDIDSAKIKEKSHLHTNILAFGPFDAPPNSASTASMPVSSKASDKIHMPKSILSMLYSKDLNRTKITMPSSKGVDLQKPTNQQTQQQLLYELDSQPIPASQMFASSAGFNTQGHSIPQSGNNNHNILANHSSNLSSSVNHNPNSSKNLLNDQGTVKFMSTKRLFEQRCERNNLQQQQTSNDSQIKKSNSLQRSLGSQKGLQNTATPSSVKKQIDQQKQLSQQSEKEYYAQQKTNNHIQNEKKGDKDGENQRLFNEFKTLQVSQVQQLQQYLQEGQQTNKQLLQKYQGVQQEQQSQTKISAQQQVQQQMEQYYQQEHYQLNQKQKIDVAEQRQQGYIQTDQQALILGAFNKKMEKKIEGLLSLNKRTSEENTEPTRTTANQQKFGNNIKELSDINTNINQGYLQTKVEKKIEENTNQLRTKYVISDDLSMKFFVSPTNAGYQQQQQQQQQNSCQPSHIIHQSQNELQLSQVIQQQVSSQILQLQQQQQEKQYQNIQQSQGQQVVQKQLQSQQLSQPFLLSHKSSFKKSKQPTIEQSQQYHFNMSSSSPSPATMTATSKLSITNRQDHLHSSANKRDNSIKRPSVLNTVSNSQQFFTLKPKSPEAHNKNMDSPIKLNGIPKKKLGIKNNLALSLQYPSSKPMSKEIRNKKQLEITLKKATNMNLQSSQVVSTTNQRKSQPDQFILAKQHDQIVNEFSSSLPIEVKSKDYNNNHHAQISNSSTATTTKTDKGISKYVTQIKQSTMDQLLEENNINAQSQIGNISHSQPIIPATTVLRKNRIETPINLGFRYYNTSMDMHNRYHNPEDYFCMIFREHFIQTFNALRYCKSLDPIDPLVLEEKLIELPLNPIKKKTIIFDLDETLVHCNEDPTVASDMILPVTFPTGECVEIGLNIRPFAKETLIELSRFFEIIIFTASHQCYAEKVIEYLDPNRSAVDYILSREHCVQMPYDEVYIKDLRILKNRDLKDIVLIDNAAYSFGFQIDNGIPIIPFFENKRDMELKYIIDFLKKLIDKDDVRPFLQKTFKLQIYTECDSVQEALERVYGIENMNHLEITKKTNDDESIDLERYEEQEEYNNNDNEIERNYNHQQGKQQIYQNNNSDDELDLERYEGDSDDLEAESSNQEEIEKTLEITDL